MNRIGWTFLTILLIVGIVLGLSMRFGTVAPTVSLTPVPPPVANAAIVQPVVGITAAELKDTWNQAREGGQRQHEAIDIIAPGGTPVVAAMAGRVERLFVSERGGLTVYVRSEDGRWLAYYAHLAGYASGLVEGKRVVPGTQIGFVGDTGNAGPGNNHLHFALHRMRPGEPWYGGEPVNPYPLLARAPPAR